MQSSVASWLKSKDILVPNDWVSACIDFVKSESRNAGDLATLKKLVYEQWLLMDLADLEKAVLPVGIKNDKYVLMGTFCLQMNNLKDVSQPKYSQLQKIQKKENLNNFVSAETQYTQKPWESKPSRMFMLELTDGVTTVSGMEYTSIPKLNERLAPGTKVKIKGPVTCRRGVLMLNQSNVEILGGEVEDLLPTNNYEAILCRGLNRPIPAQPTAQDPRPGVQSEPAISHNANTGSAIKSGPDIDLNEEDLDELMADVDFDEDTRKSHVAPSSVRSEWDRENRNQATRNVQQARNSKANSALHRRDSFDDLLADIDFEEEVSAKGSKLTTSGHSRARNANSKSVKMENTAEEVTEIDSDLEDFLIDAENEEEQHHPANPTTIKSSSSHLNVVHHQNKTGSSGAPLLTAPPSAPQSSSSSINTYHPLQNAKNTNFTSCQQLPPSGNTKMLLPVTSKTSFQHIPQTTSSYGNMEHSNSTSSNSKTFQPNPVRRRQVCDLYICEAKRRLSSSNVQSVKISVKAVVITLLSKLNYEVSTGWSLGARICDGTEMLDVEFSNNVLEDLIGFTATEAERVKINGHREDCDQLKEGIDNCRETIFTMCHYMDVKMEKSGRNIVLNVRL